MTPGYIAVLSKDEREAAIKLGMTIGYANHGIMPNQQEGFLKKSGANDWMNFFGKTVVAVSLLGGIPLGAAAHLVHRKVMEQSEKEKEYREKLKYYRAATGQLESGLAGQGVGV